MSGRLGVRLVAHQFVGKGADDALDRDDRVVRERTGQWKEDTRIEPAPRKVGALLPHERRCAGVSHRLVRRPRGNLLLADGMRFVA